jgi:hypothetical protein
LTMAIRNNRWIYLAVFAACALFAGFILNVAQMTIDNIRCQSREYTEDNFLAYCVSKNYGDYEHGALYFGLEPGIGDSIRSARVIFLGSSRTQAAFSTDVVRDYFAKSNVRFFVMGFGYTEASPFALAVLKRWDASPQVFVINADPFFSEFISEPATEALEGRPAVLWRLSVKMVFQRVHRFMCSALPFTCPDNQPAIFRSARNGQWNWIGPFIGQYIPDKAVAFQEDSPKATIAADELEKATTLGEKFLHEAGLDRKCVVLTGTPNSALDSVGIAKTLAAALKTSAIFPSSDGLATVGGGHLNLQSAERWSGAFVEALTPILKECLSK